MVLKTAEKFEKTVKKQLLVDLNKKNISEVPKIAKIVVAVGVGHIKESQDQINKVAAEIAKITGQKAKINLSRKSISAFKLRTGQPVGLTTTLRGERMYDFLDKFINVALPRVRDFRGLKGKSFDGCGNYSIGLQDYSIFPEYRFENSAVSFGLEINISTTAKNDTDARALLVSLGFPFEKK